MSVTIVCAVMVGLGLCYLVVTALPEPAAPTAQPVAYAPSHRPEHVETGSRSGPLTRAAAPLVPYLARFGLPREERKFSPHVTLARIGDSPPERVGRFIAEHNLFQAGPFTVDRFVLYESQLGRSGSTYHELRSYPLGGWRPGST